VTLDNSGHAEEEAKMKYRSFVRQLISLPVVALLLVPAAIAQLTGTVDFTSTKQQIDGFGVAATFGRSWFIQSATGTVPSQVVDQLFNPVTGAGISILRLGIDDVLGSGASSGGNNANSGILIASDPGSCSATPTYTWDHSAGGEVWLSQQALKYGVKRFYADSWGAPGYMKTNNRVDAGGVVCDGTPSTVTGTNHCTQAGYNDCRAAYANYMLQYLKFYLQDGVPITDLGWINEPNANTTYASMTPTSTQAINFLKVYGPIMRNSGIKVNQVCCDVYNWSTANTYNTAVINDPEANSYVDIYSAHEYGRVANFVLNTGTPAKKNWMTEWGPSSPSAWNPYWDDRFAGTSNNYNDGMFIANDIANALNKGQISAYIYWYADSTSTTGAMLEMGGPWVSGQTYQSWPYSTYTVPARLYALAHFARYVRPGAYQVTMSTNTPNCSTITQGVGNCIVPTAFINPDGTKVISVVNNYTSAQTLNLTLDAGTADWVPSAYVTNVNTIPNAVANSATPPPTNSAIALTPGLATVSGTALSATFPARSMTTVVLAPPPIAGTVQIIAVPSFMAQGDGTVLGTVKLNNLGTGTAQNVQLTSATFGIATGTTLPTAALPYSVGDIAPGGSATVTVNFASGQTPGSAVIARFAGTYSGSSGNGSFVSSSRTVVPALPGN
jgi:glucuronoarabinoxylan endo-1,4-beta-xylanase